MCVNAINGYTSIVTIFAHGHNHRYATLFTFSPPPISTVVITWQSLNLLVSRWNAKIGLIWIPPSSTRFTIPPQTASSLPPLCCSCRVLIPGRRLTWIMAASEPWLGTKWCMDSTQMACITTDKGLWSTGGATTRTTRIRLASWQRSCFEEDQKKKRR